MSKLYYGSINLSELIEQAKEKHTAFNKGNNGKIYANISVWLNDEPDQYDNIMSIKLAAKKEAIAANPDTGKIYIGNCKESENQSTPLNSKDTALLDSVIDDLPF